MIKTENYDKTGIKAVFRRFFMTLFILVSLAVLFIAVQLAGDRTMLMLEGRGFPTVTAEDIKNCCIILFGMLK